MSSLPSLLIDYKKQVSLLSISMFYTPILVGYDSFVESTRQAEEIRNNDEYSSDDYSNSLIETMDDFNGNTIKDLINDTIIEYTNGWNSNAIDDFIKDNYNSSSFNCDEYVISEVEIQQLRDKLFSFFKIFENQLNGMSICLQKVEKIVNESDDLTNNLRGGLTGGAIGGILGSILLPGIGTVAGAAAGGYFLNKNKSDKTQSSLIKIHNDYVDYSNQFIDLLRNNASNFLVITEHFTTYIYESRLNKLYYQANALNMPGEEIVINFLKNEINEGNLLLQEKIDVEDENSDTFQDWAAYTHHFITQ